MLVLQNHELRLDLLDPVADAARLGPRYCWGGYIWQVYDADEPLLRGPEWPHSTPTAFNGQGLPESFRYQSLDGRRYTWDGETGVALGAGSLGLDANGNASVVAPCPWNIDAHADRLIFRTQHAAHGFDYELMRAIELTDREVRSITQLTNRAADTRLALEWFAHPFFALVDGTVQAELPAGTSLRENAGFVVHGRTLMAKRRFTRQDDGHMDRGLRLPSGNALVASLGHPLLRDVRLETSFAPDACIIWGNDRTFSFEPYLTLDLAAGETRRWSLLYRFGPRKR